MAIEKIVIFHHDGTGAVRTWSERGELVRCVNCKWFQDERNEFTGSDGFCPNVAHGVSENWFCADGERKEQNDE